MMNVDNPLGSPTGSDGPGPGYIDPSTLSDEERRIATELSTALATTTYEIRDKLTEVMPGLFLASGLVAQDLPLLREHRVTHVLNLAPVEVTTTAEYYAEDKMVFKAIESKDEYDYNIMEHWEESKAFIDEALGASIPGGKGGRIVVHCQAGINRSGAIALAYMMFKRRRDLVDAAKSAKRKRYQLITNSNFQLALVKWASGEGLLGKPKLPRRLSSPNPYPGSPVPTDEFGAARWPFGCKGKPAVMFFHGTFAPIHLGHLAALQAALEHVRTNLPELNLAGAFFSPCHQVEALSVLTPDEAISLDDRLAMLRLACPGAAAVADLPVAVDTWECSQMAPPPLSTSVRSFARRAAAAAIRRGLDVLPVVVWVVGTTGLSWNATDGMDVDPSLVAVCVVVDKGQEQEEEELGEHIKNGPLEKKVRWVHAVGPGHTSKLVREKALPIGVPPVEAYMREHLLWHQPNKKELYLAKLVHQAIVRETLGGDDDVVEEVDDDEDAQRQIELVGNLLAFPLREERVFRVYYTPPPLPPMTPAETPTPRGTRFFQELEGDADSPPQSAPLLPPRYSSNNFSNVSAVSAVSGISVSGNISVVASASAFSSVNSISGGRPTSHAKNPVRRLIIKLFPDTHLEAMRVEEEAYRELEFVRLQHDAALALPSLVGVAKDPQRQQAALVFEDAAAQGWEMVADEKQAQQEASAAAAVAAMTAPAFASSLPSLPSPIHFINPPSPVPISSSAAAATPQEKVLKAVRALAWIHAKNWGRAAAEDEQHYQHRRIPSSSALANTNGNGLLLNVNVNNGGGLVRPGEEEESFPPMWRLEEVQARSRRLNAALTHFRDGKASAAAALNEATLTAMEKLAQDVDLLAALYRPQITGEEVAKWGLPQWMAEAPVEGLTLIHGGLTWDKLGFSQHGGEGVIAVGWKGACVGAGAWDVALLLATAPQQEEGREAALKLYHGELQNAGVEEYSFEVLERDFRRARAGLAPELMSILVYGCGSRSVAAGDGKEGDKEQDGGGGEKEEDFQAALKASLEASIHHILEW